MKAIKKNFAIITAGMGLLILILNACNKDDDNSLPPIGGYNSSNDVAAANLVGYWSFDGTYDDSKQSLTGTNTGGSFVAGLKGQAYKGSGNSYVRYSSAGTLGSLASYTISTWINEPAQPINNTTAGYIAGQGAQGILFMYDNSATGTAWNLLHLNLEPYSPVSGDSLRIHAGFNNTGSTGYQGIVPEAFFANGINKWVHLVQSYDGNTSTYTIYKDGAAVEAQSAWGKSISTKVYIGGNPASDAPMGNIAFAKPPGGLIIGAFPQAASIPGTDIGGPQPWSGNFQGSLDELRIYNKALSASDVSALYQLELAGR